ncbi:ATP-grasp domain-containing protein [Ruminococcaceae bacterium OttesenSCG-928-D13]|nr:ATP-grasp domain-containing protein [Ruminococcaceae bacterium OttesenSCG-928-D13]
MAEIIPVLLGADMNCYTMARAFHEAYGVVSHAFGRWAMGETKYSRIVKFTPVEKFDTDPVMLKTLEDFARAHPDGDKVALGCTDDYAAMLIRNRETLRAAGYTVPYIDVPLMEKLVTKESFYRLCDEHAIPYPATVVLRAGEGDKLDSLPFAYPVIVKPSSSISYWKHEFEGMKKVYTAKDAAEAKEITNRIFASGYPDSIIVQDMIPGADDKMRVLTAYCDRNARVKMMCLGHLLLEEHTPRALGNHAAIVTEYNGPLMETLKNFLEAVGYTGFANFDIKYDTRDGQYKVFEINLRLGRSNYYVTGAGLNLARYVTEDAVRGKDLGEPVLFEGESYWHSIPNAIVWKYTDDLELVEKAAALADQGRESTALGYGYDLRLNPLRRLYLWEHYRRYHKKYATYCKEPER